MEAYQPNKVIHCPCSATYLLMTRPNLQEKTTNINLIPLSKRTIDTLKGPCDRQKFSVCISLLMTKGLDNFWLHADVSVKVPGVILIKETCHMSHENKSVYQFRLNFNVCVSTT